MSSSREAGTMNKELADRIGGLIALPHGDTFRASFTRDELETILAALRVDAGGGGDDNCPMCGSPMGARYVEPYMVGKAEGMRLGLETRPTAPLASEVEELDAYDAGLLGDGGGGNVEWWQDYIRAELDRAHSFYNQQLATRLASQQVPVGEVQQTAPSVETGAQDDSSVEAIHRAPTSVEPAAMDEAMAEVARKAIFRRAVEIAGTDETEEWYAEQLAQAALTALNIPAMMDKVRREERERCAKVAEEKSFLLELQGPETGPFTRENRTIEQVREQLAQAIRAGEEK